jgi:hypothetical protein
MRVGAAARITLLAGFLVHRAGGVDAAPVAAKVYVPRTFSLNDVETAAPAVGGSSP